MKLHLLVKYCVFEYFISFFNGCPGFLFPPAPTYYVQDIVFKPTVANVERMRKFTLHPSNLA
jgi:hypothetical protein